MLHASDALPVILEVEPKAKLAGGRRAHGRLIGDQPLQQLLSREPKIGEPIARKRADDRLQERCIDLRCRAASVVRNTAPAEKMLGREIEPRLDAPRAQDVRSAGTRRNRWPSKSPAASRMIFGLAAVRSTFWSKASMAARRRAKSSGRPASSDAFTSWASAMNATPRFAPALRCTASWNSSVPVCQGKSRGRSSTSASGACSGPNAGRS